VVSRTERDLGLDRIRRATRFLAVGAIVGAGTLSALVARALPGKSGHSSQVVAPPARAGTVPGPASTTQPANSTSPASTAPPATASQPASTTLPPSTTPTVPTTQPVITPPTQAPQPVVAPPVVNSGGS
jgi:hypothetical protein